ncbi:MAG TPA: hypothetical protein EYG07_00915 [Alphaproteobacteria bacterium]|jgi:hypothetical protein|nr:hypothetical protein [Alphaproteobacteria bacterium]|tara:strand:- start:1888 stop:2079 length:192 start_codon:yes stop_codon:yes gene_type:complete
MNYHPIMGILILILCILIAYFIGKIITKNNILKWRKTKNYNDDSVDVVGDANSPDAPWMKNKE